jgi:hypothetical protein
MVVPTMLAMRIRRAGVAPAGIAASAGGASFDGITVVTSSIKVTLAVNSRSVTCDPDCAGLA